MARVPFTPDEVILCAYAARFDGDDFGGLDAIHGLVLRSRKSIHLKIQNIAAMLDEEGVERPGSVTPLTGLPAGQKGRRTNWDVVLQLAKLARGAHLAQCTRILRDSAPLLPGDLPEDSDLHEGAVRRVLVNSYERDPRARRLCIAHYGPLCTVCGFGFEATYGEVAEGFIQVHHVTPLSEVREQYRVDPVADLRPVCPNCHAVIHLGGGCRSIAEVRRLLEVRRVHG